MPDWRKYKRAVRIAFDLDNTLIPERDDRPIEPSVPHPFFRLWFREPLRAGTIGLLKELQSNGHTLWIYTTSNRDPIYLKRWFGLHGIRFEGIVNYDRHNELYKAGHCPKCSKYPPAFGIDLLIDDSDGVEREGKQHGFRVLVVDPTDTDWTVKVLAAVGP